jgi:indoleamine 2,3-dioxygenase
MKLGSDTRTANHATLARFDVHPETGFLPTIDPSMRLPAAFNAWEELARELDKQLIAGTIRRRVRELPALDTAPLHDDREIARAMLLLSYFGHAYVWGMDTPEDTIPANIAVPWYAVAQMLGRPPVLSYASHALNNWRRFDPSQPIALGNIARLENFLGGADEDWFVLIHIDIEGKAGPAMQAIIEAQAAVVEQNTTELVEQLGIIANVLVQMLATLSRMPEKCDPYIYYTRVRPFIFGWKDNQALPNGVWYAGVDAYRDQPQTFRGETGAQSSIIPSIHAALGINYTSDPLRQHLIELRDYMPPLHRQFIGYIEQGPSIRKYVQQRSDTPELKEMYNACVEGVYNFQAKHLEYAGLYVHTQSQRMTSNPVEVGTGGTPFMQYLKKHRDDLTRYML